MKRDEPFQTLPTNPNYLGSYQFVQSLLKSKTNEVLQAIQGGANPADAARPAAEFLAKALLGMDPSMPGVPNWNAPGGIDLAIAQAMDLDDGSPLEVMEHWAVALFTELLQVANYADEPGVTPEQWQWQAQDAYDDFTKLALGIPVDPDEEDA